MINNNKAGMCDLGWCRFEYRWADGVQIKKPIVVSASKYVDYLMDWIEVQLDNESLFPQKIGIIYGISKYSTNLSEMPRLQFLFNSFI